MKRRRNIESTGSHRSHESFVAREAKKVDVFYSNGDVPDGLAGIDAQRHVIFTAQSGDLFQRGEATRNVAGGGQHEEVRSQRQGLSQSAWVRPATGVKRHHDQTNAACFFEMAQGAHDRVVFQRTEDDGSADRHLPHQQQVERLRSVFGECKTLGLLNAEEGRAALPNIEQPMAGFSRQPMTAPAGVSANFRHEVHGGVNDAGCLGKTGGRVVKVDHGARATTTDWLGSEKVSIICR